MYSLVVTPDRRGWIIVDAAGNAANAEVYSDAIAAHRAANALRYAAAKAAQPVARPARASTYKGRR